MDGTALQFAAAVRTLVATARRLSLPTVPSFRSPPRSTGVERSLRRHPQGGVTVAVRLKGRPWAAVLADMVEGVVIANELPVIDAAGVRAALWSALQLAGLAERAAGDGVVGDEGGRMGGRPTSVGPRSLVAAPGSSPRGSGVVAA